MNSPQPVLSGPLTLGLETSGIAGSIALSRKEGGYEERRLQLGLKHGQSLIPEIGRLMADHGRQLRDVGLIAVSIGPGSFTGLRVGVVCAKALAYAIGCRIVAVDTFLAIACNAPRGIRRIAVLGDAQREDLFVGDFERDPDGSCRPIQPVRLENAAVFVAGLPPDAVITGIGIEKIRQLLPAQTVPLSPEFWRPCAATIASLGDLQATCGDLSDIWSLEPFYLRKSAAEEKWEQKQGRRE